MSTKRTLSLLIVDDDPVIRRIHQMLVSKLGFEVNTQVVKNGKEAVDLYCSGESFDVVFMDLEMPIMDGAELIYYGMDPFIANGTLQVRCTLAKNTIEALKATKELRKMGVKSMIVGVTSRTNNDEKEAFIAAGLDDCYGKPLTMDKINSLVEKLEMAD